MISRASHEITVLLGSNAADASRQMAHAYKWLGEHITITAMSGVYPSPPYGGSGSEYLNRVVTGRCSETIAAFEAMAKAQEALQGRVRGTNVVAIDIDLISYDGIAVRAADMTREYFLQGMRELRRV